jgi:hypothetical protein
MLRALILLISLLALEGGVQLWRNHEPEPSKDPLFFWKDTDLVGKADPTLGHVIEIYEADRGMESFRNIDGGGRLQTMYMEWDDLEAGPFTSLSGHETEVCNIAAGFTVLESRIPRVLITPDAPTLEFYYARLADPAGRIVHAYKMPWFQGLGAWNLDSIHDRSLRLKRSFIRHRGAARVVQFGVTGIADEQVAWNVVQSELRDRLEWRSPLP